MINKKVSIVIPTFNRANYLTKCIDSCLSQTVPCEIIVCDHGSTDNTSEVIKKYGNKVKYIKREIDSGVHFCWLDGILHTTNDLIHINFDDDWIEPTFIEECVTLFNDQVGCVFSEAILYLENSQSFGQLLFQLKNETGIYSSSDLQNYNIRKLTSPGAGIFRKKVLIDSLFVGKIPFAKNEYHGVGPDILFSLMSCIDYPYFGYVNKPLAIFRAHDNSITIDAGLNVEKQKKIKRAYEDAKLYFFMTKTVKAIKLYNIVKLYYKLKKAILKSSSKK
jgi:glycosyltransferase involved in cell wall biosynthesis